MMFFKILYNIPSENSSRVFFALFFSSFVHDMLCNLLKHLHWSFFFKRGFREGNLCNKIALCCFFFKFSFTKMCKQAEAAMIKEHKAKKIDLMEPPPVLSLICTKKVGLQTHKCCLENMKHDWRTQWYIWSSFSWRYFNRCCSCICIYCVETNVQPSVRFHLRSYRNHSIGNYFAYHDIVSLIHTDFEKHLFWWSHHTGNTSEPTHLKTH